MHEGERGEETEREREKRRPYDCPKVNVGGVTGEKTSSVSGTLFRIAFEATGTHTNPRIHPHSHSLPHFPAVSFAFTRGD